MELFLWQLYSACYKISKHIFDHEFVINGYDLCTSNMMVDGEQLMIEFRVDNLMASYKD